MATRSKRPCAYPMCSALVDTGYCDKHKKDKQIYEKPRESAAERGYDSRWQKARQTFLEHNPLCIQCMDDNEIEPATVVDHIVPHKGDMGLFWDKNNWQPLCKKHHDIKTAKEDGGFGNRQRG